MKLLKYSLVLFVIAFSILAYKLHYNVNYFAIDERFANRVQGSVQGSTLTKFTSTLDFQITHIDGTSTKVHIGKFECCVVNGMVQNGEMYIGYWNEVPFKAYNSTTTKYIPEINMEILVHELFHLVTLHNKALCKDITDRVCQETNAYDMEHLYMQVKSMDEDSIIRLAK